MKNSLHFSEWRSCIRAQQKVDQCAPGAPKGPKFGMSVCQYEILCANDAGRAPRKYPEFPTPNFEDFKQTLCTQKLPFGSSTNIH